jgi:hypothetical protein
MVICTAVKKFKDRRVFGAAGRDGVRSTAGRWRKVSQNGFSK